MGLNLGSQAMIAAMRAAQPATGLKKLTAEVNQLLPEKMRVEKHELRDFVRSLDQPADQPAAVIKPRDEAFTRDVAEQAFLILREAEREYLLNLDHESITKMHDPSASSKCHPVAHQRHHMQVFLVLEGIQPCMPFVSPKETGIAVMSEMVLHCLLPVMEQLDLESYGFRLLYIAADVKTTTTTTTRSRGFKGSWVLADTQSAAWALVRDIFAPAAARPGRVPARLMCAVLGAPVCTDDIATCSEVVIKDRTEYAVLRDGFDQDTCHVDVVRVLCGDDGGGGGGGGVRDWQAVLGYYAVCRDVALRLGTVLTLDLGDHPMMEQWCGAHCVEAESLGDGEEEEE